MTQYEVQGVERATTGRWMRPSALAGLVGGGVLIVAALAMLSVPNEAESVIVEQIAAFGMLLLVFALPGLYASERGWFGRLAAVGFWIMAVGWSVATVGAIVTTYTMPPISEAAFVVLLVALLVALIGAFGFGVAILRTAAATVPHLGGWLLIAAIPVGLPFTIGFTQFVMGELAEPWAGPLLLYGLAWIAFGRYLWGRRTDPTATGVVYE